MNELTLDTLLSAVGGGAVALRTRTELKPAGGDADKVFPPSYLMEGNAKHKYAVEERQIGEDRVTTTVLLDSVASQANRAEQALREGWERGELVFPVPFVDFSADEGLTDYDRLTVLDTPHRLADAIFRDSLLDGTLFRLSDIGQAITEASPRNATDLYRYCPTALLFGQWDSTGPRGGLGSKFQRAYVSEIVGLDAQIGSKVGSRIDPLQIEKLAPEDRVFNSSDPKEVWTHDPAEAKLAPKGRSKGNPEPASRGRGSGTAGQPSKINHGNVAPTIDAQAGGVTISRAIQTTVISFAALRRLRFKGMSRAAEAAARTSVAALGIAAVTYLHEMDYDLRSRCLLLPTHEPRLELLNRGGMPSQGVTVSRESVITLVEEAAARARSAGIGWCEEEVRLEPAPKLLELLRRSRKAAAAGLGA